MVSRCSRATTVEDDAQVDPRAHHRAPGPPCGNDSSRDGARGRAAGVGRRPREEERTARERAREREERGAVENLGVVGGEEHHVADDRE